MSQSALAAACDISEADVAKKMTFWISRGAVREVNLSELTTHTGPSDELGGVAYEMVHSFVSGMDSGQDAGSQSSTFAHVFDADHDVSNKSYYGVFVTINNIYRSRGAESHLKLKKLPHSLHMKHILEVTKYQ